ncbi:hypothetical protein MTF65_05055 [Streptomyces sp. APSN-46.1]|uniref:hypothetical protein n=1 Tax=Streptomyces sp. APSN-46.1 TaxID=2929049 RepID=UPI001FB23897|nr:hypothetical protein [Streptomyces sp. APSN-46.1]MCJ1676725.1 hypothetical protein [Streptomyces sp. APSN-46.1]
MSNERRGAGRYFDAAGADSRLRGFAARPGPAGCTDFGGRTGLPGRGGLTGLTRSAGRAGAARLGAAGPRTACSTEAGGVGA